jgi:hypothetical protein
MPQELNIPIAKIKSMLSIVRIVYCFVSKDTKQAKISVNNGVDKFKFYCEQ